VRAKTCKKRKFPCLRRIMDFAKVPAGHTLQRWHPPWETF
jgi:hypothetical protein